MATYKERREQIWMIQVRVKGSDQIWSCTSDRWFHTREEVREHIRAKISPYQTPGQYLDNMEYRPKRYLPAN
ncbi:MAG TPA: hypothetical protein VN517_03810 [Terriglobales bacterium]|nr:hypothetical protein [Terriglobales bacterium]